MFDWSGIHPRYGSGNSSSISRRNRWCSWCAVTYCTWWDPSSWLDSVSFFNPIRADNSKASNATPSALAAIAATAAIPRAASIFFIIRAVMRTMLSPPLSFFRPSAKIKIKPKLIFSALKALSLYIIYTQHYIQKSCKYKYIPLLVCKQVHQNILPT